ncbi:hypothetical protein [Yaniella sp.]|uniref:hypothetical protein n=1 Tax=Yaniella sp. TaxID=2773929 RepID=UPI003F9C1FA0
MYLDDSSPVIRGGIPDESRWLDAMLDAIEQENQPILSVFSENLQKAENIQTLTLRIIRVARIRHGKIAIARAGEIRTLGLDLEHDPSNGQSRNRFHIVFPKEPRILEIRELVAIFSQPFPNLYR